MGGNNRPVFTLLTLEEVVRQANQFPLFPHLSVFND
jgi:hypothetical protein